MEFRGFLSHSIFNGDLIAPTTCMQLGEKCVINSDNLLVNAGSMMEKLLSEQIREGIFFYLYMKCIIETSHHLSTAIIAVICNSYVEFNL